MGKRAIDKTRKIDNKTNRKVALCKRRRGFIKKAIELSRLCDQKIFIVMYDNETEKILQFSSQADFHMKKVYELIKKTKNGPDAKIKYEQYTN